MSTGKLKRYKRRFDGPAWDRVIDAAHAEGFRSQAFHVKAGTNGFPEMTVEVVQLREDEAAGDK